MVPFNVMISQKLVIIMFPENMQRLLAHIVENVKVKFMAVRPWPPENPPI